MIADGLKRSVVFDEHGLLGIAQSFLDQPPHAPYSTLIAMLGFSLIPNTRLGSYALDSLWVLLFFALIAHLLRGLPVLSRIGIMTAALAVPLLASTRNLRPVASWSWTTSIAQVSFARIASRTASHVRRFHGRHVAGASPMRCPSSVG